MQFNPIKTEKLMLRRVEQKDKKAYIFAYGINT